MKWCRASFWSEAGPTNYYQASADMNHTSEECFRSVFTHEFRQALAAVGLLRSIGRLDLGPCETCHFFEWSGRSTWYCHRCDEVKYAPSHRPLGYGRLSTSADSEDRSPTGDPPT